MKGTFFQRPLEFKLNVEGESWQQGELISGDLTVKNHGAPGAPVDDVQVHLAHGKLKKVHEKSADALEILESRSLGSGEEMAWSFQTDRNCPITDNTSSLFILYGRGKAPEQMGQLQLNVKPFALIEQFLDTFLTQFRFVVKARKAAKTGVEAKLAPPDSPAFAFLEHLLVTFRFEGDDLELRYTFKVKKIEASAATLDVKNAKKDVSQVLAKTDYLTSTGRVNHERLEAAIRDALATLKA